MRSMTLAAAIAIAALAVPAVSLAAACPGTQAGYGASNADRQGNGSGTTATFVGPGFASCMGTPVGAATMCAQINISGFFIDFNAKWPSTAARTMDAVGGCNFTCPGVSCRVGQNGLPVELLTFGVD